MGSTWKTFDVSPRRGRSGPIIFEHVGERFLKKRLIFLFSISHVHHMAWSIGKGGVEREKVVDQLEREGIKNAHF